ncbi:ParB/RepB/Spo0J family partition protein [Phenylobacterium sp.]|uniref:ParB/RepB/Spo0J family partition protein n=1 Tax=Phenylobacterium sp. TaxID=1871053 RepID=UPI0035B077DE
MNGFVSAFDDLNLALAGQGDQLATLPLDLIDEDAANPRDTFDAGELAALAATIHERGVLQPIVVRPADSAGRYRIRFGARRYRAARLAGLSQIPALIRNGGEGEAESLIEQVIENDQRATLSTAQLARTVAQLLDHGLSQAEIGARLGRPKDGIAMLAAVPKMPPSLQELAGVLGVRTLYELFQAWRADASGLDRWLEGRDPETITQAQARALAAAGRSDPSLAAVRPEARPGRRDGAKLQEIAIDVLVDGRPGQLVLLPALSPDEVLVTMTPGSDPVPVTVSGVKLVGVRPNSRAFRQRGRT